MTQEFQHDKHRFLKNDYAGGGVPLLLVIIIIIIHLVRQISSIHQGGGYIG